MEIKEPSDINLEDILTSYWVIKNNMVNEKGDILDYSDRLFLIDILNDTTPEIVIKKCAQVGASVTFNLKCAFACEKGRFNVIYTMPSDDDVSEFVKTKADKLFQANPRISEYFSSDTVGLKQIADRFIYYKGTKSKTAAISTTADLLLHDELDRSDFRTIETYQSRTSTSKYKGTWKFSNPSLIGVGVDVGWEKSDKKEWFVECPKCKHSQFLVWENNVDEINEKYVCKKCNGELTSDCIRNGKWKKTSDGLISGYHISQMMAPWLTPHDLLKSKEENGEEYFRNFVLGEPYASGDEANLRRAIFDSWTSKPLEVKPLFMGIDIGRIKHFVVGSANGVFKIGTCESKEELESVIEQYDPQVVVIDAGPETTWAEEIKNKYIGKVYLCRYRRDKNRGDLLLWGGDKGTREDIKDYGIVWADRTRIIDRVVNEMIRGNILYGLRKEDLEKYIKHWESMRKIIERDASGMARYIWQSTNGVDHYCHATIYYYIAKLRMGAPVEFMQESADKKEVIQVTKEGFKMAPIENMINQREDKDNLL